MSPKVATFGETTLPREQSEALRKAIVLEWVTIGYMITCIALVYLVMGSSQAMKAAWIEDMLALVPPLAFLIAIRQVRKNASPEFPFGRHRTVASGHLAASVALLMVGLLLIQDSAMGLIKAEHPPIGTTVLFGHTIWAGWLMIAAMVYTAIGPVLIARAKMPLAQALHDRVLFADADMQKADWMTALGTIVGVLGIGFGLWWADATVAIVIAGSIVHDGWSNLRFALRSLVDGRARSYDNRRTHPLVAEVARTVRQQPWVQQSVVRVRDLGHLMAVEAFVVPIGETVETSRIEEAAAAVRAVDWKLDDVVIMPVRRLPSVPDPLADAD